MRGLTKAKSDSERGAAGVMVAGLMLVLIGTGALAVDVGQIYAERAQLQYGADSGAIAIAQACLRTGCDEVNTEEIADTLADGNANDGDSNVSEIDFSVPKQVTVRTTTKSGTSEAGFLSKMFSQALNAPPVTVGAHATAALLPPGAGSGFPLAISDSCFNLSEASDTAEVQKISYKPGVSCNGP